MFVLWNEWRCCMTQHQITDLILSHVKICNHPQNRSPYVGLSLVLFREQWCLGVLIQGRPAAEPFWDDSIWNLTQPVPAATLHLFWLNPFEDEEEDDKESGYPVTCYTSSKAQAATLSRTPCFYCECTFNQPLSHGGIWCSAMMLVTSVITYAVNCVMNYLCFRVFLPYFCCWNGLQSSEYSQPVVVQCVWFIMLWKIAKMCWNKG